MTQVFFSRDFNLSDFVVGSLYSFGDSLRSLSRDRHFQQEAQSRSEEGRGHSGQVGRVEGNAEDEEDDDLEDFR